MKYLFTTIIVFVWFVSIESASHIQTIQGSVGAGNFTYYSLQYEGDISLYLYSSKGDADIYVSQELSTPSYNPEQYCLHSASCGLDIVHIPASFKRPVGIGIYGHPSYDISSYILELKQRSEVDKSGEENEFWINWALPSNFIGPFTEIQFSDSDSYANSLEEEEEEDDEGNPRKGIVVSFLLTVMNIILEVFLL